MSTTSEKVDFLNDGFNGVPQSMKQHFAESFHRCKSYKGYHFDTMVHNLKDQVNNPSRYFPEANSNVTTMDLVADWKKTLGLAKERGLPENVLDMYKTAAIVTGTLYKHAVQGQQTFIVGENLHRMLRDTSLKGVLFEDIKLPYETFYIDFPKGIYKIWGGDRTQWHDVMGIYVRKTLYFEKLPVLGKHVDDIMLVAVASANDLSAMHGDDANAWSLLSPLEVGAYRDVEDFINSRIDEDSHNYSMPDGEGAWILKKEVKPETRYIVDCDIPDWSQAPKTAEEDPQPNDPKVIHNQKIIQEMTKVVINAILYLNNGLQTEVVTQPSKQDLENLNYFKGRLKNKKTAKSRGRVKRQICPLMKPTVVHLAPHLEKVSPTYQENDIAVRGHWWPKENTDLHKARTRWIKPYVRRPTSEFEIKEDARTYVLERNKNNELEQTGPNGD